MGRRILAILMLIIIIIIISNYPSATPLLPIFTIVTFLPFYSSIRGDIFRKIYGLKIVLPLYANEHFVVKERDGSVRIGKVFRIDDVRHGLYVEGPDAFPHLAERLMLALPSGCRIKFIYVKTNMMRAFVSVVVKGRELHEAIQKLNYYTDALLNIFNNHGIVVSKADPSVIAQHMSITRRGSNRRMLYALLALLALLIILRPHFPTPLIDSILVCILIVVFDLVLNKYRGFESSYQFVTRMVEDRSKYKMMTAREVVTRCELLQAFMSSCRDFILVVSLNKGEGEGAEFYSKRADREYRIGSLLESTQRLLRAEEYRTAAERLTLRGEQEVYIELYALFKNKWTLKSFKDVMRSLGKNIKSEHRLESILV